MKKALIFLMACVLCLAVACVASAEEHNTWDEVQETQRYQAIANNMVWDTYSYISSENKSDESNLVNWIAGCYEGASCDYTFVDGDLQKYAVHCETTKVEVAPAPNCCSEGTARIFCMRTVTPIDDDGNPTGEAVADKNFHYHYVTLPKTAHKWTHTTEHDDRKTANVLEEATCYKEGKVAQNYCSVCGKANEEAGWVTLPKTPHHWVWFTVVPADCKHLTPYFNFTNLGVKVNMEEGDTPYHPSAAEKAIINLDIAAGYGYRIAKCVNPGCGAEDKDSIVTVALSEMSASELKAFGLDENGHKWGSEDAMGNPCNVTKACSICGRKEQRTLDADIAILENKLDNCYTRAVTYGCKRCNGTNPYHRFDTRYWHHEDLVWNEVNNKAVVDELVKQLKDIKDTRPNTTITVYYDEEPIAHEFVDFRAIMTEGVGYYYDWESGKYLGWGNGVDPDPEVLVPATCTTDGWYRPVCKPEWQVGGYTVWADYTVTIPKTGHTFNAYKLSEEHSDGNHVWIHNCTVCGYTEETVAAENPDVTVANEKAAAEAKAAAEKAAAEAAIKNGLCLVNGEWGWYASDAKTSYTGFQDVPGKGIFYFTNGVLDTSVLGVKDYNGAKFLASDGKLRTDLNGVVVMGVQEAYWVAAGKIATDFTGIQPYGGSAFYFVNGKIDFTKTGTVNYNGVEYTVNYGEVDTTK